MRKHPKYARVDSNSPRGWATCMRSGFVGQEQDLIEQVEWRGLKLMPTGIRALAPYIDKPQRQLGTIILSPDPVGLANARPEQYPIDEVWPRLLQGGQPRYLQRSECSRSLQSNVYFSTSGHF
jgi:hypothetical protein